MKREELFRGPEHIRRPFDVLKDEITGEIARLYQIHKDDHVLLFWYAIEVDGDFVLIDIRKLDGYKHGDENSKESVTNLLVGFLNGAILYHGLW